MIIASHRPPPKCVSYNSTLMASMEALGLHVRLGLLDPSPSHLIGRMRTGPIEVRCGEGAEEVGQPGSECCDVRPGRVDRVPLSTYVMPVIRERPPVFGGLFWCAHRGRWSG